jgi:glycosyltransferase involved in cell wall biosynthesis
MIFQRKKILISCINSHNYGGFAYWSNFLKNFKKHTKKTKNTYCFIINQNSEISKNINLKNFIIVKEFIHNNVFLRFLYEQIYIPLFIFKKYDFDFFFNAKNIAPTLIRKKSIIVIQNIEPFYYHKSILSIRKLILFLKFFLTTISLKGCYAVISVSKNTKKIIKRYTSKKIFLIPNGVSVSTKYKNKWSQNNVRNYILNSSKFIPYANQLRLLKIYKEAIFKNANLPPIYFAGDIYDKKYFNEILEYVSMHKLENKIKFLGYLSKNKLHLMMKNCKLFIFSSELESCPQTILEARLIGCPILSTNIEPMPEFLQNNSFYFDLNNIDQSAKKLINIIYKINKTKLKKKKILNDYNWQDISLKYFDIFENYLK